MTSHQEPPTCEPSRLESNGNSAVVTRLRLRRALARSPSDRFFTGSLGHGLLWLFLLALLGQTSLSTANAAVTDLLVVESGQDAILTWSTGTPPFRVFRSDSPNFYFGNHLVAQGLGTGTVTDVGALEPADPSYFYLVLDGGDSNPPGWGANPPRPVPFLTSLTPDSGSPGDVVTIDGGSFEPDGAAMTVRFQDATDSAEIVTASETQLTVVVPDDALTGDVFVCWAGECSNSLPFKVVFASGFEDISSIAFEPGTGSLWVADRGTADDVLEIDSTGNITVRGSINQPLLGHPAPDDGSGRIYYSNSLDAVGNLGTIEYIASATNSEVLFDQAGVSGGNSIDVRCEGIAATPLESDVAYFLDGRNNSIRRIVRNAFIHDLMYGDQPFTFNRPAGARFDSEGNLYISAVTSIFKIAPQEASVTLVASGFTAAAGIDLSEASGIPTLLVADEATGNIWLVNGETGDKEIVGSGFSGPVGVAFTEDATTGDLFYDVAEPTRILRLPDPRIEFAIDKDVRVLISTKNPDDNSYPTAYQTKDGKILVRMKVTDKVDPAGMTLYLRVVDPKDGAVYANTQSGDNRPTSPGASIAPSVVVDQNGFAEAILEIAANAQFSGNNYEVEVSITPPPNFKKASRSKEFIAWRRVYFEHDRMFKEGEFVTQTSSGDQVFVGNPSIFAIGEPVMVISSTNAATRSGEVRTVTGIGLDSIFLDAALNETYFQPENPPSSLRPYSFVAKSTAGAFEAFDAGASAAKVRLAFDDPFTEWARVTTAEGYVPYFESMEGHGTTPGLFLQEIGLNFFDSVDSGGPLSNHVHVISGAQFEATIPPEPALVDFGTTIADTNQTGLWLQTIDTRTDPGSYQTVVDEVFAHELAHQFDVNIPTPQIPRCDDPSEMLPLGHDCLTEWGISTAPCLMHPSAQGTGVRRFHSELAPSIDLYCIRGHEDDLNSASCTWAP